jgi:hypothetical protein
MILCLRTISHDRRACVRAALCTLTLTVAAPAFAAATADAPRHASGSSRKLPVAEIETLIALGAGLVGVGKGLRNLRG